MSIETIILLQNVTVNSAYGRDYNPSSDASTVFYSEKHKGSGYNRRLAGLQTVVYAANSLTGYVTIQGTLELFPGDNDWVDLDTRTYNGDSSITADPVNLVGNFIWLRAAYHIEDGEIMQISYNY